MIQVKIFEPRLVLSLLCFLSLIVHELGLGDKENRESTYNEGQKCWHTLGFMASKRNEIINELNVC